MTFPDKITVMPKHVKNRFDATFYFLTECCCKVGKIWQNHPLHRDFLG